MAEYCQIDETFVKLPLGAWQCRKHRNKETDRQYNAEQKGAPRWFLSDHLDGKPCSYQDETRQDVR